MPRIFVYEACSAQRAHEPGSHDLLEAGRAMRDAIVHDLLRLPGAQVACAIGGGPGCGLPLRHERLAAEAARPGEEELAFVRRAQAAADFAWIVAPETGGRLERLQAAVAPERRLGCEPSAIRIAGSKRATIALMAAHGIATPRVFQGEEGWVVKPDDGAGTQGARVHAHLVDACADQAVRPGTVIEPWVVGEALSISLLAGPDAAQAVAFNRQRIVVDAVGRLVDEGVEPAALATSDPRVPALRQLASRATYALPGLRGFVGIDAVWHPGHGAVFIELNPRTTCAVVGLSARLGRNLAGEVLARAMEARDAIAH